MSLLDNMKLQDKVNIICAKCDRNFERTKRNVLACRKKHMGEDLCISCVAKKSILKKPQCAKKFWSNTERKKLHSDTMKMSENHQRAMRNVKLIGEKNGMFGKKHSIETRNKMTKRRIGKTGENATAWKGGKISINKCIKKILQSRFKWFSRVFERDNNICQHCGNKGKDAHHIEPLSKIIKQNAQLIPNEIISKSDQIEWLLLQPNIIDANLDNGICLCRPCHKAAHIAWGSHDAQTKKCQRLSYISIFE